MARADFIDEVFRWVIATGEDALLLGDWNSEDNEGTSPSKINFDINLDLQAAASAPASATATTTQQQWMCDFMCIACVRTYTNNAGAGHKRSH